VETVYYFGSVLLGLGLLALQGVAVWLMIEAGYFIYTKLTGKEY
jgi:hypothetical protein